MAESISNNSIYVARPAFVHIGRLEFNSVHIDLYELRLKYLAYLLCPGGAERCGADFGTD